MSMLKRKFYDYLLEWKQSKDQECLLVKGARQVGKTYIIDYFGHSNYKTYIYINFIDKPQYKEIFNGDLDADTIYTNLALYLHISLDKFLEKNTLIFLDEIQECPNARTALKFLALDNRYDVIASGSLLGLNYKGIASIPVGYEKQVEMYSLDFEEFLWASGRGESTTEVLKEDFYYKKPLMQGTKDLLFDLFRTYMIVGGMPKVVEEFFKRNDFVKVHDMQEKIIVSYMDDIKKYASPIGLKQKIIDCFNSVPSQLLKDYTKFQYKIVKSGGNAQKYESAINWLVDSGIASCCYNVSKPEIPLLAYKKNNEFKVYFNDTGLLTCMLGLETQRLLYYNELKGNARGGIYENIIAETLTKNGYPLYYFKKTSSEQEIEFLIEKYMSAIPIEVKSNSGKATSLKGYIEEFKPTYAYKLVEGNPNYGEDKTTLPLFMALYL